MIGRFTVMLGFMTVLTGILVFQACTNNTAGIETTNGDGVTLAAASSSISGTAPAYARLSLFDTAYVPVMESGLALSTSADEAGSFVFSGLPKGAYTVIAESQNRTQAAIFQEIQVGPGAEGTESSKILEPVGSISGVVQSEQDSLAGLLVFLSGTGYYKVLPGPGPYAFDTIPPGDYLVQASVLLLGGQPVSPSLMSDQASREVVVPSGATVFVDTLVAP